MNIIINLTQSTYHQTLNIGKILRKLGQNRGKIRAKSGQIGPKPDFLGFKTKIRGKLAICPEFGALPRFLGRLKALKFI